jgi:transcriptional regulator with XRE-family HTH domain
METGLYNNDFSEIFYKLLAKGNVSCYQIHQYTHLDQGYLSNLRNGKKSNPSPETIMKIAVALSHCSNKITLHDIEALFQSVGRSIHV